MAETTLIQGGTLVTPDGEIEGDLLIAGEQIAAIGRDLATEGVSRIVNASRCLVLPGLVDPHTHIQLDTGIYKTPDNWEIGTRTAACGGVTTVIDFATQFPGQDVSAALAGRLAEIGALAQIDYGLHMMLTALPADAELDGWMVDLLAAGVPSVKVYTTYRPNYYQDDAALLRVLAAAGRHGVLVMVHCENDALVSAATGNLVQTGQTALAHHGEARPALAEVEAAHRVLFLARALDLYLDNLEREIRPENVKVKPGVEALLARLAGEPSATLGLLTGNLERGARIKLEPVGFNRYFPFGAFGSDHHDRYCLPAIAVARARQTTGFDFHGKAIVVVGDSIHDVGCGRSLGVKTIAVSTGLTPAAALARERPDHLFESFTEIDSVAEAILS